MKYSSLLGVFLGLALIIVVFLMDEGNLLLLVNTTAIVIVFGGTFVALLVSTPPKDLKKIPSLFFLACKNKEFNTIETINRIVELCEMARKEGTLSLEDEMKKESNRFLKDGVIMVVDGATEDDVREVLESEIIYTEERHKKWRGLFERAGEYAPSMGMLGTILGIIQILYNLNTSSDLGPSMSLAFISTLYGVAFANYFLTPIASKLKEQSQQEMLLYEVMLEGVVSLQKGQNPKIVRKKLEVFLSPENRNRN